MIGIKFWLNRWADLLVYLSIIFLFYAIVHLYWKDVANDRKQTELIRILSIDKWIWDFWKTKIVFVIPAYNESDHTLDIIQEVLDAWYWVVFVDDWSSNDLYAKVVNKFDEKDVLAIKHLNNLWQWAALQTGFTAILQEPNKCEYVVTFDSDGQHCLKDLKNFLDAFKKDPKLDIVLWSRFLGSAVNMPISKKIVLKIWIIFTSFFSWLRLTDTHNWYRVIKLSSLPKIKITMNWMAHASEILDIISREKLKYAEVPNTILYTDYSMARGQKLSNSLKIVKNLIFEKFFS